MGAPAPAAAGTLSLQPWPSMASSSKVWLLITLTFEQVTDLGFLPLLLASRLFSELLKL